MYTCHVSIASLRITIRRNLLRVRILSWQHIKKDILIEDEGKYLDYMGLPGKESFGEDRAH
jgi:hypothetical protein